MKTAGIVARGFAMGAADVVPGVSGGTLALVLGIYPRFISALSALDASLLRRLLVGPSRRAALREADVPFLFTLGAGIVLAIGSLSKIIPQLMANHPEAMNGLFFGMIAASVAVPLRLMKRVGPAEGFALVTAAAGAFVLTGLGELTVRDSLGFLFASGAIAICAMLLPGISGSFLLLILGQYTRVLSAIDERDLLVLAVFGAGIMVGILGFSRLLKSLLHVAPDPTYAALVGLMLGSLRKLWPFGVELEAPVIIGGKTVQSTRAVWPWDPGYGGPVILPLALAALGVVLVLVLERLGRQSSMASPSSR
jgi:putative membrane protein